VTALWASAATVPELLAHRAAATPEGQAFVAVGVGVASSSLSWQQFADQAARMAGALYTAGLRHGDRIAVLIPASIEWELLHHAVLSLGAIVVGLDAHDVPERLAAMCDQVDVVAVVAPDFGPLAALSPERWQRLRFVMTQSAGEGAAPVRSLGWAELLALPAPQEPPRSPQPDDLATLIFTSGTTGTPKAIPYRHRQVCAAVHAIGEAFGFIGVGGRLLCWLPLSNLFQRMVNLAGLRNGATTFVLSDPRQIMDVVALASPDVFIGVPRFFEKLHQGIVAKLEELPPLQRRAAQWAWQVGRDVGRVRLAGGKPQRWLGLKHRAADRWVLSRLRTSVMGRRLRFMITGSAPTPPPLLTEFYALGWPLLEAYGLSENVMPMAMNRIEDFRFGTVGKPFPGNELAIGPDDTILVRSACLARPAGDLAGTPVDAQGYYDTGDLGSIDADGFVRLSGRKSEVFKTSTGRRVSPYAAEAALRAVPGIDQAVLVGAGRKCVVALCATPAPVALSDRRALQQALSAAVEGVGVHERPQAIAMVPHAFTVEHGELTPNLKLRRAAIEQLHAEAIEAAYAGLGAVSGSAGRLLVVWPAE